MNSEITLASITAHQPKANFLQERNVLVTGAANGIGRAVALACAAHGASVVLLDIDTRGLKSIYDEIESNGFPLPAMVPLDFQKASMESWEELAGHLEEEFGSLHGLIHCAADVGILCPLDNYDLDTWQRVMHVNFTSAYLLTRACLPMLRDAGNGSIIFTSSDVARQSRAYWGAYAVAGHALEGLAQVWTHELSGERPVAVNTIDPGIVATRLRQSIYPAEDHATLRQPHDVVPLYTYVLEKSMKGELSGAQLSVEGLPSD
jgi:NAD(P)-dependent dehydrogenase (short-subunit alcohol dehydrogenase family)